MRQRTKIVVLSLLLLLLAVFAVQGIGINVSYLLPRNGMFSHPVTPLSFRDIGRDIGRYLGVVGSLSLYSIRGMGIKDEAGKPIDTGGPLVGPFLSVLSSAVGQLRVPLKQLELEASGGVFGCYNIDPPLMTGTLDRYLATADGKTYDTVTSSVSAGGRWARGQDHLLREGTVRHRRGGQLLPGRGRPRAVRGLRWVRGSRGLRYRTEPSRPPAGRPARLQRAGDHSGRGDQALIYSADPASRPAALLRRYMRLRKKAISRKSTAALMNTALKSR